MWCEIVGCESPIFDSTSQAHNPLDLPMAQQPGSFSSARMRLRTGSAMARSIAVSCSSDLAGVTISISINIAKGQQTCKEKIGKTT
jgi:hypothetical protein